MGWKPRPKFWAKWGTALFLVFLVAPPYTVGNISKAATLWVGTILFVAVIQLLYPLC